MPDTGTDPRSRERVRHVASLLALLTNPKRLMVLTAAAEGERHIDLLRQELGLPQPAVSHRVATLSQEGVVTRRRQGRQRFYALTETCESHAAVTKSLI